MTNHDRNGQYDRPEQQQERRDRLVEQHDRQVRVTPDPALPERAQVAAEAVATPADALVNETLEIGLEYRVDVRVELVPGAITALQDQAGVALVVTAHTRRTPKRLVQKCIAHALEQPGAIGRRATGKATH